MVNEIKIPNSRYKRVAKDIMGLMESMANRTIIKQELKTHTSLKNPDNGDEVKIKPAREVGEDVTLVDMTLAGDSLRSMIRQEFGDATDIPNGPSNPVDREIDEIAKEMEEDQMEAEDLLPDGELDTVFKPFTHGESRYRSPGDPGFDQSHERCRSCAHFDDHGNCRIVSDIESDGYCEEFYADLGVFGHEHEFGIENNLNLFGEDFDWDMDDVDDFVEDLRERLQERVRGG